MPRHEVQPGRAMQQQHQQRGWRPTGRCRCGRAARTHRPRASLRRAASRARPARPSGSRRRAAGSSSASARRNRPACRRAGRRAAPCRGRRRRRARRRGRLPRSCASPSASVWSALIVRKIGLSGRGCGLRGRDRQVDRDVDRRQRRRHHEDDQQHQHHVDERGDVDLVRFGEIVVAVVETDAPCATPPRRSFGAAAPRSRSRDTSRSTAAAASPTKRPAAGGLAREHIVDDHRRDRRDEPHRGREQRLGDAGRDDREVRGLRLRDADKAVHDAPDRAEQADKRAPSRRSSRGCRCRATSARRAAASMRSSREATRSLIPSGEASVAARFLHRGPDQCGRRAGAVGVGHRLGQRCRPRPAPPSARRNCRLQRRQLDRLGQPDGPGDDRGEREADHHRLHDAVGGQEHAPRRQVVRQRRAHHVDRIAVLPPRRPGPGRQRTRSPSPRPAGQDGRVG